MKPKFPHQVEWLGRRTRQVGKAWLGVGVPSGEGVTRKGMLMVGGGWWAWLRKGHAGRGVARGKAGPSR